MAKGHTTTTAGSQDGGSRFGMVAGDYGTVATDGGDYDIVSRSRGGGTRTAGGPKLCVESNATTEITIHLDILQEITTSMALPFTKKQVYFEITGYTKIKKSSERNCLPKEEAEAMANHFEECEDIQDQSFTPFSMGGDPPFFLPLGRSGRLFKWKIPKSYMSIKKIKPAGVQGTSLVDQATGHIIPGTGRIAKVGPVYKLSPAITWQKVNVFREFEIFVLGSGNYSHRFSLDLTYKRICPPTLCGPCGTHETGWGDTVTQHGQVICENQNPYDMYNFINISDTMDLDAWIGIDEGDGGADGYLDYNEPFWTPNSISPTTPYQVVPVHSIQLPQTGPWQDPETFGTTPDNNVLVQGEGPGYARYQGFGVDIFSGRDNDLSQALHLIPDQIRNSFSIPPSTGESPFCGNNSSGPEGNMNINAMLRTFASEWEYNSNYHDAISEMLGR